jgi:beta-1,4-mannosyltransferase
LFTITSSLKKCFLFLFLVDVVMKTAYVIVLGDLGRSPRMCNHALSLANEGFAVTLLGHGGSSVTTELSSHSNVKIKTMPTYPNCLNRSLPRLLCYVFKVLWQTLMLLCALPFFVGPDFILLQNPPTIPPLIVCYFYTCFHRQSRLVLDWHNYGFSIMALALGRNHILVKLSKYIEDSIGRRVPLSFCVSKAMKKDLESRLDLSATVLYDRPPESFRPITIEERHQLFEKLSRSYPDLLTEKDSEVYFQTIKKK